MHIYTGGVDFAGHVSSKYSDTNWASSFKASTEY